MSFQQLGLLLKLTIDATREIGLNLSKLYYQCPRFFFFSSSGWSTAYPHLAHIQDRPFNPSLDSFQINHRQGSNVSSTYKGLQAQIHVSFGNFVTSTTFTPLHSFSNSSTSGYKQTSIFLFVTNSFPSINNVRITKKLFVVIQGGKLQLRRKIDQV